MHTGITLLAIASLLVSGCFSFVEWTHNLNQLRAWNEELNRMNRTTDRSIFNYDYDDPSRDIEYERPDT